MCSFCFCMHLIGPSSKLVIVVSSFVSRHPSGCNCKRSSQAVFCSFLLLCSQRPALMQSTIFSAERAKEECKEGIMVLQVQCQNEPRLFHVQRGALCSSSRFFKNMIEGSG